MFRISSLALCLAVLVAPTISQAASKIERIASPSGVMINFIKCSGKASSCMNAAAKYCKGSYQVLGSESHAGGLFADVMPGPIRWYSMTFLCGKSDGALPTFPFQGPTFKMPTIIIPRSIRTTCTTSGSYVNCTTY